MATLTATAAGKVLSAGIDIAYKVMASNLGKSESRRLVVYYWGMVLFELRQNIVEAQEMTRPKNDHSYGTFTLKAWYTLYEVLSKLAPMPRTFSMIQLVNDQFREISMLLRTAVDAPDGAGGIVQWNSARLQAKEILPRALQLFTDIRSLVESLGREAFDANDWQTQESEILPDPVI